MKMSKKTINPGDRLSIKIDSNGDSIITSVDVSESFKDKIYEILNEGEYSEEEVYERFKDKISKSDWKKLVKELNLDSRVSVKTDDDGREFINIDAGPSAGQLITQSNELFKNMKAMARSLVPAGKNPEINSALVQLAEAIDLQSKVNGSLKMVEEYIIAYTRGGLAK